MRIVLTVFLFLALLVSEGPSALAFVVEGPEEAVQSATENLERAPRWGLTVGSLQDHGERGLGGGLEYAFHSSLCDLTFVDGASCEDVRSAIRDALDMWGEGHPLIVFVDISGRVSPDYPRRASDLRAVGAEIDFFGSSPRRFRVFNNPAINGYTVFYDEPQPSLVLTNGQIAPGPIGRITGTDVHFNTANCYYIDVQREQDKCVHFPSLVLHEISHILGIGHPEERIGLNLDTDDEPGNEVEIDCRAPLSGLKASPRYDGASVAHGYDVHRPGRWRRGLSWDDVAARDALYPHCGIERIERSPARWGAFAIGDNGAIGEARLAYSDEEASAAAQRSCQAGGLPCRTIRAFKGCFAFAANGLGASGQAVSPRSDHARVDAVLACSEQGADCKVISDFCAYD